MRAGRRWPASQGPSAIRIAFGLGIVVFVQEERSQHKNKAKALKMLRASLTSSAS
jgi:protein subunit release factor A